MWGTGTERNGARCGALGPRASRPHADLHGVSHGAVGGARASEGSRVLERRGRCAVALTAPDARVLTL